MSTIEPVEAARHISQEARVVLCSLRTGPPHVARGSLAQDLVDLRDYVQRTLQEKDNDDEVEEEEDQALYARPFLQVVMDPRAAGPHTLVALRALYRLLQHGILEFYQTSLEELTQGVLQCKFEQTDAGADEAVEMAIADVLLVVVQKGHASLEPATLMDAFNTVFVTRNTFVHSPALCYHFEDVLTAMVRTVFGQKSFTTCAVLVLEFLVNQLLHTPLVGGDGLDESTREAQTAHDATRVSCLRLVRVALQTHWKDSDAAETKGDAASNTDSEEEEEGERTLLQIIQDDLCLSLLMTGQAIWAYHDDSIDISPGFVSLQVLSEICATLSTLWNTLCLRTHLIAQFESILTGFYQRALVLLRKRQPPTDSLTFNANLVFDAEVEIILESLVDILCLHNHSNSIADGDGGALETMFAYYDCHMQRSDVAVGLMVEFCRCCGGSVNEDGQVTLTPSTSGVFLTPSNSAVNDDHPKSSTVSLEEGTAVVTTTTTITPDGGGAGGEAIGLSTSSSVDANDASIVDVEHPWRQVPAHLKELCARALMGGMKCLFRDDKPCAETMMERAQRRRSIMPRQVTDDLMTEESERHPSAHLLRDVKAKKRLMRKAARIFNKKASRGIEFLLDAGLVPDPVTPKSVAIFLRNGIVVGLDKKAVGAYLGEAGKGPAAGKNPPCWDRDWFHKDVLKIYCSLFRFERQSLIDGLRMFLACFRLPGEAQQIDRILQAFSDSCGQVCDESANGRLKLFSEDPKRASDTAYLLSFSIIMLNTDLHNDNIREDRKMKLDDFVRNNRDYGRDITEKGKEFPHEFLESIYDSIREEEIRTEGEGAEGAMTVERWKDVLRGSTVDSEDEFHPSTHDAEDLTELVLEHVWKPIMSAIGAFWGFSNAQDEVRSTSVPRDGSHGGGMMGVQGARLAMDMAFEMLAGVRQLGRIDIFRKIFSCVCTYTEILGPYMTDSVARTWLLTNSVEAQSAIVVALRTALDSGEDLDIEGWKRIWSILFEMRDLKLIAHRSAGRIGSLLHESDADLLSEDARRDWTMCLIKGDMSYAERGRRKPKEKKSGVLGAFGRALFGSDDSLDETERLEEDVAALREKSVHGKEDLVVWDDYAPSDDEEDGPSESEGGGGPESSSRLMSPGAKFEGQLIRESLDMSREVDMPVTGLERVDETRHFQMSPRARVRIRFLRACNLKGLISESRFMDESSIVNLLLALVELVAAGSRSTGGLRLVAPRPPDGLDRSASDASSTSDSLMGDTFGSIPLSPASEAFAEVLICEIALKNKDRLKALWSGVLQDHYLSRLARILVNPADGGSAPTKIPVDPGLEKRVTGLLRLSVCAVNRGDLVNDILPAWKYLLPMNEQQHATSPIRALDRHIGEGLWRIVADVDGLKNLDQDGWEGLISLMSWSAKRAGMLKPLPPPRQGGISGLAEDDPALQTYRSLHLILNTKELQGLVPCQVVESLRSLVSAGVSRNCPQLSIASLDLLNLLYEKKVQSINAGITSDAVAREAFWSTCWKKIVEGIAEAAEKSPDSNVRQHALSMLTDLFLDKQGSLVPINHLCGVLSELCVPLAGRCIVRLQMGDGSIKSTDQLMIEFELCIGLIFKPLRHHLENFLASGGSLSSVWQSVLAVLEELLREEDKGSPVAEPQHEIVIPRRLKATMNDLANEHLRNAIMVLISAGVLLADSKSPGDISAITWESVSRMGISEGFISEWKTAAGQAPQ